MHSIEALTLKAEGREGGAAGRSGTTEFEGAVVLITGGGSGMSSCISMRTSQDLNLLTLSITGIGQCCAYQFALHGCQKLFLVDLTISKLEETKRLIEKDGLSAQVELYEGNVSDEASVKGMVTACVAVYGRIDIACNNAGVSGTSARTSDVSMKDYDFVCSVNERGVILCEKYELSQMLGQERSFGGQRGVIINIASIAGHCIIPTASPYTASKHAVVALSRCDALTHAQNAIRINAVSPGAAWTPMLSGGGLPQEFIELGKTMAPMHRYLEPIEVASPVLFLASPKASAMTGVNLPVDGGTLLLRSM